MIVNSSHYATYFTMITDDLDTVSIYNRNMLEIASTTSPTLDFSFETCRLRHGSSASPCLMAASIGNSGLSAATGWCTASANCSSKSKAGCGVAFAGVQDAFVYP